MLGTEDLDRALVDVQGARDGGGTGFFVGDRTHILTCSHVVLPRKEQEAGAKPPTTVSVRRPGGGDTFVCLVDVPSWSGVVEGEDVALLRCFAFDAQDDVRPLALSRDPAGASDGSTFVSGGFPSLDGIGPIRFSGGIERRTYTRTGSPILQVTRSTGLTNGCSGAPAVGDDGRVVGMVRVVARPDVNGALAQMAFLTPADVLADLHPGIANDPDNEVVAHRATDLLLERVKTPVLGWEDSYDALTGIALHEGNPLASGLSTTLLAASNVGRLYLFDAATGQTEQLDDTALVSRVGSDFLQIVGFGSMPGVWRITLSDKRVQALAPAGWREWPGSDPTVDGLAPIRSMTRPAVAGGSIYYVSAEDRYLWRLDIDDPSDHERLCRPPAPIPSVPTQVMGDLCAEFIAGIRCFLIADCDAGLVWRWQSDWPAGSAQVVAGGGIESFEPGMRSTDLELHPHSLSQHEGRTYVGDSRAERIYRVFDGRVQLVASSDCESARWGVVGGGEHMRPVSMAYVPMMKSLVYLDGARRALRQLAEPSER